MGGSPRLDLPGRGISGISRGIRSQAQERRRKKKKATEGESGGVSRGTVIIRSNRAFTGHMAMRSVAAAAAAASRRGTVVRLADSGWASTATRAFSDGKGKVLSEEELAAEKIYIQKMEKEKLEKLKHKAEKEKAEKEKQAGDKKA